MRESPGDELRSAWAGWLEGFGFDTFGTITFRERATSAECACDRAERFLKQHLRGIHLQLQAFMVAEEHKLGGFHVHVLLRLGAIDDLHGRMIRQGIWEHAFHKWGMNRWEPIRSSGAVRAYVGKYLSKRMADYRLVGLRQRDNPPVVT